MANRRMGGMGGQNRGGNRNFPQHQPFQGNVNPWQGNQSNNLNEGLFNQLSNPQQLALALTSLLQPQQQSNNPPPLLSLNASPAFSNQDRDLNRFGNRGRDFRRHEPYNKPGNRLGGGWRDGGRTNNQQNRNQNNRGPGGNRKRSPFNKNKPQDFKKKEEVAKKKELTDNQEENAEEERKRDWKEEKNNDSEINVELTEEEQEKRSKEKEGTYHGVPIHLLHCHVCGKDMWDGESFEKHVRGRAHRQMLESLEESFHITVNILRENMRLAEEKKLIELNRAQRLNKKPAHKFDVESHCNMCDFKVLGKIMAHRKTDGHQRLKRFLHPNCVFCDKEFPSRMEWVEHRLTPEHLRALAKHLENKTKNDGAEIVTEEELDIDLDPIMEETVEHEDDYPILDLDDDMKAFGSRVPAYRRDRALASKSLQAFTGFMCNICNVSFVDEELAQKHLKSLKHYQKFVETIRNKYQKMCKEREEKDKKEEATEAQNDNAENEEAETTQELDDSEMYDPEDAGNEEETEQSEQTVESNGEIKKESDEQVDDEAMDVKIEETSPAKMVKQEPAKKDIKQEPQSMAMRGKRVTNVKNGAGPKSKKTRK